MKKLNIRTKLLLLVLATLIPMVFLNVYRIYSFFQVSIDTTQDYNNDFAEAVSVSFNNFLERLWDAEHFIGLSISSHRGLEPEEIDSLLKNLSKDSLTIEEYAWLNSEGKIVYSSSPDKASLDISDRDYIREILNGKDKTISSLLISRITSKPTVFVARAIRENNILRGIMLVDIDLDKLPIMLASHRSIKSSSYGLIDKNGIIIYDYEIPDIAERWVKVSDTSPAMKVLQQSTTSKGKYFCRVNKDQYLGVYVPVADIGWAAYANVTYREVIAFATARISNDIIALILITTICILLALEFSNRITKKTEVIKQSAKEITKGHLNIRTNMTGHDELAVVGQEFDKMASFIEEYDSLKNQFFSNISHELKTPLNIILTSIQLLDKMHEIYACENYVKNRKYIDMMRQNCFRLLRLINNLIDISRFDAGYLKLNTSNYNIISIVEEITESVTRYAEFKGITLIFDTETEEKIIACDPDKIERIVLNLLSNALKFTKSGGYIFVNIHDKDDYITISVKDTGIGIPADKLATIFERFNQVDSSLSRANEGSGIGLSLVKALIEAHGGSITANSEYGKGSEFIVTLPCILVDDYNNDKSKTTEAMDKIQKINIEFSDIYSISLE